MDDPAFAEPIAECQSYADDPEAAHANDYWYGIRQVTREPLQSDVVLIL